MQRASERPQEASPKTRWSPLETGQVKSHCLLGAGLGDSFFCNVTTFLRWSMEGLF